MADISATDVLVFGDTPRDIKAGQEAGVKTVGVASGVYSEKDLSCAGANFTFPSLKKTDKINQLFEY
jgi:phosphoglycolate phosphatase-like HAD superfamily hydrolase